MHLQSLLMNKNNLIFGLIILIAFFLRFWQLDQVPSGAHADEADTAYSAYSILKTGLTQYGTFNPLAFTEFNGGTHPPLYTYFLIPFVKFFGLNIFVERMPSAVFGTLTIPIFYFLLKKILQSSAAALVGSFFLTVNPWFLHMSRQGLLESIAVFFVVLGITLFVYAKEKKYLYILSFIAFGLSLHAYDAPKIFVPLFLIALIIYQYKSIIRIKKYFIATFVVFVIFYLLMLKTIFLDGQINDYNKVSLFNTLSLENAVNYERQYTRAPLWLSGIFHNKATVLLKQLETSYFNIFSINWLFINGEGNLQQAVVRHGQFHLFELPLFFVGAYALFRKRRNTGLLLMIWLLLAPIPGALTQGNYPYRSVLLLPAPIIFSSYGLVWLWSYLEKLKQKIIKRLIRIFIILLIIGYTSSFIFTYFFDYPVYASKWWFKERNEALNYAISLQDKYDRIFIDGDIEWAVMYAFNGKVSPHIFQNSYKNKSKYKNEDVISIGKFTFGSFKSRQISSPSAYFPKNSIVLTDESNFSEEKGMKIFTAADPLDRVYKIFEIK
ncbi:phospholipid carrier-dependent glycosyltransferase [Candidatus Parcubacteria bacterium]|nr:MAG: phospholipid carrier-dependent glycosyltransferase [Candidatus Parcubacteria bacterium]